jgi:hypothetical protein
MKLTFENIIKLRDLNNKLLPLLDDLCENFKRRLYEKDPAHYAHWEHLGQSVVNYYFVDGQWLRYENGKKSIVSKCGQ